MSHLEIRFSVTPEEHAEITAYVKSKKRWKQVSHFARDCVYQAIWRNPMGGHGKPGKVAGGDSTERSGGKESEG